jgi:hypothetical protein
LLIKRAIVDIEANNLLAPLLDYTSLPYKLKPIAKIHCVVIRDIDTQESYLLVNKEHMDTIFPTSKVDYYYKDGTHIYTEYVLPDRSIARKEVHNELIYNIKTFENIADFTYQEFAIKEGLWYNSCTKYELTRANLEMFLNDVEEIIGHNIISYDLPMLMLYGLIDYTVGYPGTPSTIFRQPVVYVDTLLWSKLLQPDRRDSCGMHALAAFGLRSGFPKIDFHDFDTFSDVMCYYCDNDTLVNYHALMMLMEERGENTEFIWNRAYEMEAKIMDLAVKQEHFGFAFDSVLAKSNLADLEQKLTEREEIVIPRLPPKPMNKGEISGFTPPAKQLLKNGEPNSFIKRFAEKVGGEIVEVPGEEDPESISYSFKYHDKLFTIPFEDPVETQIKAQMKDNDHIKSYLLSLGWKPEEWSVRDLTRDSKKQALTEEKVLETIERYVQQTLTGPYKDSRLFELDLTEKNLKASLLKMYEKNPRKSIKVPTSPKIKVGTEKEIDKGLLKIENNKEFSVAFAEYSTYKHRKTSIAGGDIDEETGEPSKGYLSYVREDGRVATPADTLGASSSRMLHRNICNIPRNSSTYGENMRGMFGAGKDFVQVGFDFASLIASVACLSLQTK